MALLLIYFYGSGNEQRVKKCVEQITEIRYGKHCAQVFNSDSSKTQIFTLLTFRVCYNVKYGRHYRHLSRVSTLLDFIQVEKMNGKNHHSSLF